MNTTESWFKNTESDSLQNDFYNRIPVSKTVLPFGFFCATTTNFNEAKTLPPQPTLEFGFHLSHHAPVLLLPCIYSLHSRVQQPACIPCPSINMGLLAPSRSMQNSIGACHALAADLQLVPSRTTQTKNINAPTPKATAKRDHHGRGSPLGFHTRPLP
jgi:hypothetical protein